VSTDDDGEVVGQGDAPPGGDEGLGLERFVAVPGVQQWRSDPGTGQDEVDAARRRAVVRPDPGVGCEVGDRDPVVCGEPVVDGQDDAQRVVEQGVDHEALGRGRGLEVVLEHDGQVQRTLSQLVERGLAVDQVVDHGEAGMNGAERGSHLGGQVHERGEERSQTHRPAAQAAQRGDLGLGELESSQHGLGVAEEDPPRLGELHAVPGTAHQDGAQPSFTGPTVPLAIVGWALVGLGLAAVIPAVIGAAPQLVDAPPATAIAAVTTIGYLGSFTGPPLIGLLAEFSGLTLALSTIVVASLLTAALARLGLHCPEGIV
jgi:hypothetical protein